MSRKRSINIKVMAPAEKVEAMTDEQRRRIADATLRLVEKVMAENG